VSAVLGPAAADGVTSRRVLRVAGDDDDDVERVVRVRRQLTRVDESRVLVRQDVEGGVARGPLVPVLSVH
jgi:hypothetical protein